MGQLLVKTVNTKLSDDQAIEIFFDAWISVFGTIPNFVSLCMLVAHTSLECGHFGDKLFCWNYGNIKRTPNHNYCQYPAGEFVGGKYIKFFPPAPETSFNAYESAKDGAESHIRFLADRERYKDSWNAIVIGDYDNYCAELKKAGYFTAPLDSYNATFIKLFNEFVEKYHRWYQIKINPNTIVDGPPPISKLEMTEQTKPLSKHSLLWNAIFLIAFKFSQFFFLLFYTYKFKPW